MPAELERILQNAEVPVEFESQEEEILIRTAVMGEDAREWMVTNPVGRYVIGAALQDQSDIETAIMRTPLWRKRKHHDLRAKHAAIGNAIRWLTEAVQVGMSAESQLEQRNVKE
jgi:hypothetical protein